MPQNSFFSKYKHLIFALLASILIKILSVFPDTVERYYVPYFYKPVATVQRMLFGWIPFSLGDLLYLLIILTIIYAVILFIKKIVQKTVTKQKLLIYLQKIITPLLYLNVVFQLLWGLNYSRQGIGYQLNLKVEKYKKTDVQQIIAQITLQLNESADQLENENKFTDSLRYHAKNCYAAATKQYPFLEYKQESVKQTIFGRLINYMGFLGYYNPFTGEGQINHTVPDFIQPNIIVHEIAHQIGYAKEDEANFVGYLTAKASNNIYFKYSAYLDLFQYAAMELNQIDSNAMKPFIQILHPKVIRHLNEWKRFRLRHQSFLSTASLWVFDNYLKANDRSQGVATYNEVLALLIAYGKKYGIASI